MAVVKKILDALWSNLIKSLIVSCFPLTQPAPYQEGGRRLKESPRTRFDIWDFAELALFGTVVVSCNSCNCCWGFCWGSDSDAVFKVWVLPWCRSVKLDSSSLDKKIYDCSWFISSSSADMIIFASLFWHIQEANVNTIWYYWGPFLLYSYHKLPTCR